MKIFLIRHGESQSNCDTKIHQNLPDHEIALSSRGKEQAEYAGEFLKAYFDREQNTTSPKEQAEKQIEAMYEQFGKNNQIKTIMKGLINSVDFSKISGDVKSRIKLYHSSYRRTRETKEEILKIIKPIVSEIEENVLLIEELHGIFDGISDEEMAEQHPKEFALFDKTNKHSGKFYARYPHGESPFDVYCRLKQFFHTLKEDEQKGIDTALVVCHGIVIKAFTMAWLNKTPEWYEAEKSPGNCAIRVLEGNKDLGYIFGGHRSGNSWSYPGNLK